MNVWDECAKTGQRYSIILLVAIVSFELINRSIVPEFTIGPIKIVDVSIIHTFLPVFFSFLMFQTLGVFLRWKEIETVYSTAMCKFYPKLHEHDYQLVLYPSPSLLGNAFVRKEFGSASMGNFLPRVQSILGFTYAFLVAPAFLLYSCEQLIAHHLGVVTIISAAFGLLLFAAYIWALFLILKKSLRILFKKSFTMVRERLRLWSKLPR